MDVNVRDFGAVGNDIADDTIPFRNALRAIRNTGGTCFVPAGTYKIRPAGIMGNNDMPPAVGSGMHLVGEDRNTSILHVHTVAIHSIITCQGEDWSIENLTIQMSGLYEYNPDPPPEATPGAGPITVLNEEISKRWKIDQCSILHTGHFAIVARGEHWTISNNNTLVEYPAGTGAHPIHQGVVITTTGNVFPSYGTVTGNVCDGAGFNILGNNHRFINNRVIRPGSGSAFFSAGTKKSETGNSYNTFIGNSVTLGTEGIDDAINGHYAQVGSFELWTPHALVLHNYSHDNAGGSFGIGGHNSILAFNRCIDNGRDIYGDPRHHHVNAFNIRSLLPKGVQYVNAHNSILLGNTAFDTALPDDKTQDYGIHVQADWIKCVAVVGNNLHGNKLGEGFYRNIQPNLSTFKGRDLLSQICDEWQRETLRSLFDPSIHTLQEGEYVQLNQLLTGASKNRPVSPVRALPATSIHSGNAVTNWEQVSEATGYRLDVARDVTFSDYVHGYEDLDVGNRNHYTISGLHRGTQYFYRVRGYNSGGTGTSLNTVSFTTLGD